MLIDFMLGSECYSRYSAKSTEATTIDGLNTSLTPKANHDQVEIIARLSNGTGVVIRFFRSGRRRVSERSQNEHVGY